MRLFDSFGHQVVDRKQPYVHFLPPLCTGAYAAIKERGHVGHQRLCCVAFEPWEASNGRSTRHARVPLLDPGAANSAESASIGRILSHSRSPRSAAR